MKNALDTINTFCGIAGSKINIDKTECILIGDIKNKFEKIFEIKVTKKAIRCLGFYIGHDKEECYNQNWMRIYHNIENFFESWKRRKFTIFDKSCIRRTLAISKLIYASFNFVSS